MLHIDGARGEGGGQVLRTALGLSLVTGTPFHIASIRGGRAKPGLLRQHLACVRAAAAVGAAEVEGDTLGGSAVTFRPRGLRGGEHHVAVGSAGSALLVIQCVLPALLAADEPSRLVVEGGTHNASAPPFDFVARVFAPLLSRMGANVAIRLERHGFYPAGGGRVVVEVVPGPLAPLTLLTRGAVTRVTARVVHAGVPTSLAHRGVNVLRERLGLHREALRVEDVERPVGPGLVVMVDVTCEHVNAVFTGFVERREPVERVAGAVADEASAWLADDVPVDTHLADQLLVPLALARGGRFRTGPLSLHATTNAELIQRFVPVRFVVEGAEVRVEG
jgi:RNA 3'-terminal phosphate cyclase (ATP)